MDSSNNDVVGENMGEKNEENALENAPENAPENPKAGYADQLALTFFKEAIRHDDGRRRFGPDFFGPLVRNLPDVSVLYSIREHLTGVPPDAGETVDADGHKWEPVMDEEEALEAVCVELWNRDKKTREAFRKSLIDLASMLCLLTELLSPNDPLRQRVGELQATFRLDDDERDIVLLLWLFNTERLPRVGRGLSIRRLTKLVSLYTGMDEETAQAALRTSGRLCRYGIVSTRDRSELQPKIRYFLDGLSDEPLVSAFYQKDTEEALPTDFFGALAEKHLPVLKRLLASKREHGLNILLYGAPGSGKTSFARALAREAGRVCYQVAQRPKDRDGDYMSARAEVRYAAVEICDEQVPPDGSLVVVDEADALLRCGGEGSFVFSGRPAVGDKGLLNDILEKNKSPIVWIANTDARELDLSNRRRFDYAIRFEPLSKAQRVDIWRNAAAKAGVPGLLTADEVDSLVDRYPVNTGIVARALENVARVEATAAERKALLEDLLGQQRELSGAEASDGDLPAISKDYTLEGLNVKSAIALDRVVAAARRFLDDETARNDRDAPRLNILLTGAPGSGKTEFVKYLAAQLGRPLCVRRPSDLKSKWVGETEQNIAAAFREARERKAVLLFDEVDSFLDDREALRQGHEKSMINEVLQQMESFGGLFVGTTNFAGMLDPAVARRFTFKIELGALTAEGKRHFFGTTFGAALSEADAATLDQIDGLTPGDFRTVRQSLYYLGGEVGNAERLAALAEEARAKTTGRLGRVGF